MADDKKKKDQQVADDEDPRLDFLLNYMIKSYRLKQDKWNKMIAIPENKKMITNFFDNPQEKMLLLTIPMTGILTPLTAFSPIIKQKFTYFLRKKPLPVTMENLREVLTFGDMAGKFLDELAVLVDGLFVPVLSNPKNQKGWPKMLADDVISHVRSFKNQVDQIYGALRSETILPMPSGLSRVYQAQSEVRDYNIIDFDLKNAFENAVIQWSDLIKDVLKLSPSLAFENDQNPLPQAEIDFWESRVKNLQSIYNQMRDPRIKKMAEFLQEVKSSYNETYRKLFKEVVAALVEAKDIDFYLKPLVPHVDKFMSNDILDVPDEINPMVHVVGLIWANSRHYCTNERIINLLKAISNMLIEGVERQIDPSSIFQGEAEENYERLHKCIDVLNSYELAIDHVRENIANYYKEPLEGEEPVVQKPWIFHRRNVIQRIIDFVNRLKIIENILEAKMEYTKLEKVEFSGLRGRILSLKCEELLEDFNKAFNVFNNIQYDPMDLKDNSINKDYAEFIERVDDMDRRLAAIFSQAIEECNNIESIVKFWNIVGPLYQRPKVFEELSTKFPRLIELLDHELDTVKILYDEGKRDGIPIEKYYPPMAGTLLWLKNLRTRISKPYEDIIASEIQEVFNEDFEYVQKKYQQMMEILTKDFDNTLSTWCDYAPGQIEASMSKFQIVRIEKGNLIEVNLDDELKAILREIKYLKLMEIEPLPEKVQELYEKSEELVAVAFKFYRIAEWYNWLKKKTLSVEMNLIRDELDTVDELLDQMEHFYTWATNDNDYVEKVFNAIQNLHDRVLEAQTNINNFLTEIDEWAETPLYERKDGKKENLLNLEDRPDRKQKRKNQMMEFSTKLKDILKKNYSLYFNEPIEEEPNPEEAEEEEVEEAEKEKAAEEEAKAKGKEKEKEAAKGKVDKGKPPKKTDEELAKEAAEKEDAERKAEKSLENIEKWSPYVYYVSEMIQDKMILGTMNSLQLFLNEMCEVEPILPFFEISMELHEPYIVYIPSAKQTDPDSLQSLFEDLIDDIVHLTKYMYKADPEEEDLDYYDDVRVDTDVTSLSEEINKKTETACDEAIAYTGDFDEYMDLWTENRQTFLSQFLVYGRGLSAFEEDMINEGTTEIKESPPTIAQFKEIIDYYEGLYKKVETIELYKILPCKWLKVDARHLRQSILNLVCKWSNLFKQHLYDRVTNSLENLEEFIKEAIAVMQVPLSEDDYDGLIKVMSYLVKVKDRQVETDAMFGPLKEIMNLLKEYGMEFPEEIHVQLQEIPDRWMQCKKVAAAAKAAVGPLQALQINAIKRRMNLFEIRQNMFRNQFKQMPIFDFDCKEVYKALDKVNCELTGLEQEMDQLNEQASLFELTLAEMKALKTTRKEIKFLKQLWDFANIVRSCVDEWIYTPWKKIDVENMEIELKKFGKELRQMDKEVKGWDVYIKLSDMIKNMLTSLRAVTELQNPAIRDRHWVQLMQATKVDLRII